MRAGIGRNAAISAGVHLLVLLALIVVIPAPLPPPAPDDNTVEMDFEGTGKPIKNDHVGKVAAPAEADEPAKDLPAEKPPTPQPIQAPTAPPPPPPPPPPAPQPEHVTTLEKAVLPPPPSAVATSVIKPPPPLKVAATKEPPTPAKPLNTVTHQPNQTKATSPDSHANEANLDQIMQHLMKNLPPTHVVNAERGGARNSGGALHGQNLTGDLSAGQRKTIGDSVRRCYSEDTAAKDYASYYADMTVTIDAAGEVHDVKLLPAFQARAGADPAFRAFAERAMHAVLDPACARLPLPPSALGQPSAQLTFRFRP